MNTQPANETQSPTIAEQFAYLNKVTTELEEKQETTKKEGEKYQLIQQLCDNRISKIRDTNTSGRSKTSAAIKEPMMSVLLNFSLRHKTTYWLENAMKCEKAGISYPELIQSLIDGLDKAKINHDKLLSSIQAIPNYQNISPDLDTAKSPKEQLTHLLKTVKKCMEDMAQKRIDQVQNLVENSTNKEAKDYMRQYKGKFPSGLPLRFEFFYLNELRNRGADTNHYLDFLTKQISSIFQNEPQSQLEKMQELRHVMHLCDVLKDVPVEKSEKKPLQEKLKTIQPNIHTDYKQTLTFICENMDKGLDAIPRQISSISQQLTDEEKKTYTACGIDPQKLMDETNTKSSKPEQEPEKDWFQKFSKKIMNNDLVKKIITFAKKIKTLVKKTLANFNFSKPSKTASTTPLSLSATTNPPPKKPASVPKPPKMHAKQINSKNGGKPVQNTTPKPPHP